MLEWLLRKEKKEKLVSLRREIDEKEVDKLFIPYLHEFNTMPCVCTTQCCTGHTRPRKPGYISFRLSERMQESFKKLALEDILGIPSVMSVEETYEIFEGPLRPRTVIWFTQRGWQGIISEVLRHTRRAHRSMRRRRA